MKKICAVTTIETTMEAFVIPAMRIFVEGGMRLALSALCRIVLRKNIRESSILYQ